MIENSRVGRPEQMKPIKLLEVQTMIKRPTQPKPYLLNGQAHTMSAWAYIFKVEPGVDVSQPGPTQP